ncbi:hypothetical protein [Saccharothrix syringae]|uniref:Band 7 domain-containing protein n=1 Tax=Saccharothrix syringae TaxID=103733 RepID=A0A5Q0H169_SACSY|nr:hypothetical protein [Saccharothrix syringae]QFZ19843.1 hypothetical protein EKG83_22585 [Saccharothrix syringae]
MTTATKTEPQAETDRVEEPDQRPPDAAKGERGHAAAPTPVQHPEAAGPISDERHVRRFELLYRRLPVGVRAARVFVTRSGCCLTYPADGQPTTGELVWKRVRTVYEVDLGTYVSHLEEELPSRGDTVFFRSAIDLVWNVTDPAQVVRSGVSDVCGKVSPPMLARLRAVTRRFGIHESDLAEGEANRELADGVLGADLGLSVRAYVRLAKDEVTLEQAVIRRKVDQFKQILETGDFDQLALQLTLKPEDIASVVKVLVEERDSRLRAVFDFINRLLESEALDRWQIDDPLRTALQMAQENLFKVFTAGDKPLPLAFGDTRGNARSTGDDGTDVP